MPMYSSEHGDIFVLDDRKELGFNLDGTNYSLHPSQWYTAGDIIVKGHAISIGTSAYAVAEGLTVADAGKIFNSEQSNTDKCVGIALNGGIYGQQVEVLDHGFYPWQTNALLIITVTNSTAGTILINGITLTTTGANPTTLATSILTSWTASSDTRKTGFTLTNPSAGVVEITSSPVNNIVPTVQVGAGTTFTSLYANRTTVTIGWVAESSSNRTVLVNGVSSSATITVGTSATATATSIYSALNGAVTGYSLANPSAGVVTITTTTSTAGTIPTIYAGGSAPFTSATTTLSSTYQYTVFQPSDIGQTVYVAAVHQGTGYSISQDIPTSVTFLVQNNGVAESSSYFVLNGVTSAATINGTSVNSIAATIASYSFTGFTITNPSANIVTITATNVSHTSPSYFITSFGIGNATYGTGFSPNTQLQPTFMDFLPTTQFTTNRTLAAGSGAPLIEVGIVKDLNTIFIDFEGDTRGAVNLSQISANAGEPLAINLSTLSGSPPVVSIGTDGNVYLADRRKANGGGTSNRNNVAGFLVGANSGYTNYSNPNGTVTVVSGTGTSSSGTIVTSANPSSSSIPNTGLISVTLSTTILTYTYSAYNSGTLTYTITGQIQGTSTNPTTLAGATVWSGTVPAGIPVVIQKAGIISGFNASLLVGSPLYADYNGAYNQTLNAFSFYTDVVNPLGFATATNSVYVEVGFNTQRTDTGTIGSIAQMGPSVTVADYGTLPCITNAVGGLTVAGNTGAQAGQLNAVGTTTILAGQGAPLGTFDLTSLYATIGTSYGGYTSWLISGAGAVSGNILVNGISYSPTGNTAATVAASIAALIASNQPGYVASTATLTIGGGLTEIGAMSVYPLSTGPAIPAGVVTNIGGNLSTAVGAVNFTFTPFQLPTGAVTPYLVISNDPIHIQPTIISSSLVNYTITPSLSNGGATGTTFLLPPLNGGTSKFQMRYLNNFVYNPPTAPFFRWDSGWTAWGSLPQACTGVASQYIEMPTTQFGTDIAATDVFVELYVQSTGSNQIFQINPNPINDGAGHSYGYSLSKDIANNLRIDFAANGLAYNTFGGGFAPITGLTNPTYRIFIYKIEKYNKFYNHTGDQQLAQLWSLGLVDLLAAYTIQGAGYFDRSIVQPSHTTRLNYDGDFYATDLFVSNNFTVSNTTGTTQINATLIQLRASTASGTQIGGSVNFLVVDNNGNVSTPSNITTTGTGTLTIAGTSTFNGTTTHNASVSVTTTATFAVGSASQFTVSAAGVVSTSGSISTTGSGALTIAGLATFNGNAVIAGASASLDDTTASSTFTLFATPTTLNIGNTSASTTTFNAPTLVFSATSATMTNGTMTFGNNSHAGVISLSNGSNATLTTITNASAQLTINQADTTSIIVCQLASTEYARLSTTEFRLKGVTGVGFANGDTSANLHIQSPSGQNVGISFDVGGSYVSKIIFGNADHTFHFGGASDAQDGGILKAGVFNATSKRSIKENIKSFEERATDIISKIDVVTFNFKKGTKDLRLGFIADDSPEIVAGPKHDQMDLGNSIGLLLKAVQELKYDIDEIKKRIVWE